MTRIQFFSLVLTSAATVSFAHAGTDYRCTVERIFDADENHEFLYGSEPGVWSTRLYNKLRAIQYGDEPDKFGWITIVE